MEGDTLRDECPEEEEEEGGDTDDANERAEEEEEAEGLTIVLLTPERMGNLLMKRTTVGFAITVETFSEKKDRRFLGGKTKSNPWQA